MCTLLEGLFTFMIISRRILLRMRNASYKIFRGNQNTHRMFKPAPLPPENHAVCGIMSENVVEPDRTQMTI